MAKIYKDYEDQYVAANVIYVAAMSNETKIDSKGGIAYAFASEEPCIRNDKPVNAVKIDKDTLLDRVLKGAVVCVEKPGGIYYFAPISAAIHETSTEGGFTEIMILEEGMQLHLVSSEAVLEEPDES